MDVFVDPRFEPMYERHPIVLADVGARGGLKKNWLPARRHLRVFGFEPDRQEFSRLVERAQGQGGRDTYFNVALHNRRGPIAIHVARDAGLTSVFEPNRPFLDAFPDAQRFDTVDLRQVEADTLDHVLEAHREPDLDFIKADTQGSELCVLEGARGALAATVLGVEVEVEFAPIYKDQPLFADVDGFLRGLGFALFDLRPCYWKREAGRSLGGPYGQVIWGDALYLKTVPALQAWLPGLDLEGRQSKVLRALSVALLYGYVDYALDIAASTSATWTEDEFTAIERALRAADEPGGSLSKLPGSRQLGAALGRLREELREPAEGWSVSDPELGNRE